MHCAEKSARSLIKTTGRARPPAAIRSFPPPLWSPPDPCPVSSPVQQHGSRAVRSPYNAPTRKPTTTFHTTPAVPQKNSASAPAGYGTTRSIPSRDVELVTQVSLDRWPRFAQQALAWGGPVSVAVYLPCPPDHPLAAAYEAYLQRLIDDFTKESAVATTSITPASRSMVSVTSAASMGSTLPPPCLRVTAVHSERLAREGALVLPGVVPPSEKDLSHDDLYPINALRNAALAAAASSHVFLVDGDFIPSEGLRRTLLLPRYSVGGGALSGSSSGDGTTYPGSSGSSDSCGSSAGAGSSSLLDLSDASVRPVMWVVPAFELQSGQTMSATSSQAPRITGEGPHREATSRAEGTGTAVAAEGEVPDSVRAVVPRTLESLTACTTNGFENGNEGNDAGDGGRGGGGSGGMRRGWGGGGGVLRPFHCGRYPQPLPSVDYARWWEGARRGAGLDATRGTGDDPDDRWLTVQYHEYFEPYGVARRDQVPLYDERFRGYGLNKVQQAYSMAAAGFEFRLLTRHFCVTVPHSRSTSFRAVFGTAADLQHRRRIEVLYDKFKQEVYDKYGYHYVRSSSSVSQSAQDG